MTNVKPISRDEIRAAARQFCRQVAAQIAAAMAFRNMGFAEMAVRIGCKEKTVRRRFRRLLDGKSVGLREAADMAYALDCRFKLDLIPRTELPSEKTK